MFRRNFLCTLAGAGLLVTALSGGITAASAAPTTPGPGTTASTNGSDSLSMRVLAKTTPLKDNKALVRSTPPAGGHAYRYSTTSQFWSVVATLPDDYFDVDLKLYGDPEHKDLLGESVVGAGSNDFIVVDSNHLPLDQYYPEVEKVEYHGKYRVELAQGSKFVNNGYQSVPLLGSNFVTVYDVVLEAGKNYRFVLSPTEEFMNGSMYLMASDPGVQSSWIQSKDDFIRYVDPPSGTGGYFDITPNRTDRYGLVIVSTGEPGTFGLTRVNF